jgi:hypothetical protein
MGKSTTSSFPTVDLQALAPVTGGTRRRRRIDGLHRKDRPQLPPLPTQGDASRHPSPQVLVSSGDETIGTKA